ncbi:hypothetical protein YM304_19520 [Ilumatobacter coccineus YM16-304]|uniref:Alanine racemase N-terminal domain-containing protein n=1 Tax=Ilumatobacter coccineus (strain NBRC 103263 / KCTC 29153 / YM16-304) TaxID=1313172 RepID=A0A6C7EE71_ILUCY|nr:hypothetical protein YM304_19520 [Ilumatobacter coccineus YM16-304]
MGSDAPRPALTVDVVVERLAALDERIDSVSRAREQPITVTAVTKGFAADVIRVAADAGFSAVGENYAQELLGKVDTLDALGERRPTVEFIGRLQSNKVRQLVDVVDLWASVDRPSLVAEIAKRAPGARILVQVNSTGEDGKGGCALGDTAALVERAREAGLDVAGLMTVGPTGEPPEAARPGFEAVRRLVDELGLEVCSMGMSGDIEVAVAAGSTNVRVGTALFGSRA